MVVDCVIVGLFWADATSFRGCRVGVFGEAGPSAGVLQPASERAAGLLRAGGVWDKDMATCGGMAVPETKVW